jgi:hypothetical protein
VRTHSAKRPFSGSSRWWCPSEGASVASKSESLAFTVRKKFYKWMHSINVRSRTRANILYTDVECFFDALHSRPCTFCKIHLGTPSLHHECESQLSCGPSFQCFLRVRDTQRSVRFHVSRILVHCTYLYRNEVFQGFTHFQALDMQMTRVQEVVDPLSTIMIGLPKGHSVSKCGLRTA